MHDAVGLIAKALDNLVRSATYIQNLPSDQTITGLLISLKPDIIKEFLGWRNPAVAIKHM